MAQRGGTALVHCAQLRVKQAVEDGGVQRGAGGGQLPGGGLQRGGQQAGRCQGAVCVQEDALVTPSPAEEAGQAAGGRARAVWV
jgi:hypothetical protein